MIRKPCVAIPKLKRKDFGSDMGKYDLGSWLADSFQPLWKIKKVSWDDEIPNLSGIEKKK